MSRPVRLCVIGAGRHASKHIYPCFPHLKEARITANADLDSLRSCDLAGKFGVPSSYTDYREMLREEKPDGVLVCVGPDFHARAAMELMEMGYHVYTEKPPAVDADQAALVLAVKQRTGRICMTGFKKRFTPAYMKTREIVSGEDFGEPCLLSILRTSGPYGNTGDPRAQYLLDSAIHAIDLATYLFGPVARVFAWQKSPANYGISVEFTGGAVGTLSFTDRMSYARGWEQVTCIGSSGICVQIDNSVEMIAFHKDQPVAAHKPEFVAGNSDSLVETGFVGELQAFVDAIASDTTPESSIECAVHTMKIVDAIRLSTETGQPTSIDHTSDYEEK